MKILLDECCHRRIGRELDVPGIEVATVQGQTWHGSRNGELLQRIEGRFGVFVTQDQNIARQNTIAGRSFAMIVLKTKSGRWHELQPLMTKLRNAIAAVRPGSVVIIE